MLSLSVLGSGSSGNCTLARAGDDHFLVDCGLSARQIETRLASLGVAPAGLSGILLTHEHADHAGGLKVFLRKFPVPVFCNAATARAVGDAIPSGRARIFQTGHRFELGGVQVAAFAVPHDAVEPVGFRMECGGDSLAVVTDLGYATRLVHEALRGVRVLVIEANYDDALLQNDTKRPWSVKQRINSRHGHLSNAAAAALLTTVRESAELAAVVLCHLSHDCNSPELAERTIRPALPPGATLVCASQDTPTPWISAGR